MASRKDHVAVAVGQFTWGRERYTGAWEMSKKVARSVVVFDLSSEQRETRPTRGSPPPGFAYAAYATIGTTLYSFGGYDGRSRYNTLHRLDLSSLEWEEVVPKNPSAAPQRKSNCQVVSFQDKTLVVFAGWTGFQWIDELHVYNLQEGTWSSPPTTGDKPPPCSSSTFTKIDDHHAVMFGGYTVTGHRLNDVFILELGKWHWTKLEVSGPKPPARSRHAVCCLAGPLTGQDHPLLTVVGGKDERWESFNDVWILDVDQRRWTKLDVPGEMQQKLYHTARSRVRVCRSCACGGVSQLDFQGEMQQRLYRTVKVFGSGPSPCLVLHGGVSYPLADPTVLLNLELQGGRWRVITDLEDQLAEERSREAEDIRAPLPEITAASLDSYKCHIL